MNELRFRKLMSETVGDEPAPPWLAAGVRARLLAPRARTVPKHLIVVIAALAVVLVGAIGLNGLIRRSVLVIGPTATPSAAASPSPVAIDPGNCRLPVFVERGSGPTSLVSSQAGFVDTITGRYTRDPSALTTSLPRSDASTPGPWSVTYSLPVHMWLPTRASELAPDGRSYAWIRTLPAGVPYPRYTSSELHRYNVATSTDVLLWTYAGGFAIQGWDSSGILVDGGPVQAFFNTPVWLQDENEASWWLIDPATGAAAKHASPKHSFPPFKSLPGEPTNLQFGGVGLDAQGHMIWNIGYRYKSGTLEWVFYETAPGQRVTIYRGTDWNAIDFNPDGLLVDSTGIWLANNVGRTIWHWQVGQPLRKVSVSGLPPLLAGANSYVQVTPAGACF